MMVQEESQGKLRTQAWGPNGPVWGRSEASEQMTPSRCKHRMPARAKYILREGSSYTGQECGDTLVKST